MTISNVIFKKFDTLIKQAKELSHNDPEKIEEIRAEIQELSQTNLLEIAPKIQDIDDLISKIDGKGMNLEILNRLRKSRAELEKFQSNIIPISEREYVNKLVELAQTEFYENQSENRKKYILAEKEKIIYEMSQVNSFFNLAEFANRIWSDMAIYEEFGLEEDIIKALVQRLNETNQRDSFTHIAKEIKKTLGHIRQNLFKSQAWSDEDIIKYQQDRDLHIKGLVKDLTALKTPANIYVIGASSNLVSFIKNEFPLPQKSALKWIDIFQVDPKTELTKILRNSYLCIILTMFPENEIFEEVRKELEENKIEFLMMQTFDPSIIFSEVEVRLDFLAFDGSQI